MAVLAGDPTADQYDSDVASRDRAPRLEDRKPLYDKVYRALRDEIESGALRPGDHLPSERALAELLDVSRITVRRGVQQLVEEGFVDGRRVASFGEPLNSLVSFSEMAAGRGLATTSTVISASVREATIDEAEQLRIPPGGPIFALRRARTLGGLPIALDENHLSYARVEGIEDVDFSTTSLYGTLRERFGIVATRVDYSIEAVGASAAEAKLLDVDAGSALLRASEVMYDQHEMPTDFGCIVYRGDRYRFRTTLTKHAL
jgi:GntR family transcriptional regulator